MEAQHVQVSTIIEQSRERKRRARLHRQIGALEAQFKKCSPVAVGLELDRKYRLRMKIRRLQTELVSPELPL